MFYAVLIVAYSLGWYMSAGQFLEGYPQPWWAPAVLSIPTTYLFWYGTRIGYTEYGNLWQVRALSFCVSTVVFFLLTWLFLRELPSWRDWLTLALVAGVVALQATR